MPINLPDNLTHSNSSFAIIDATGNQVKGIGFFANTAARDALSANLRVDGYLAIVGTTLYKFGGGTWGTASDWDEVGGATGATALDGLSDVAFSSGDLTITGLDKIVAASALTLDVGGNIVLDADGGTITFSDNGVSLGTITSAGYSGKAATATKLAATKTIAGVAFDGSANISLNNNSITNGAGYTTATGTVGSTGSPVDNDFAKFTDANTIEGRSYGEVKTDLALNNVDNKSSATIRGEIVSGNIPNNGANTTGTAAGLSATLAVGSGGTGATTLANNSILVGNGTGAIEAPDKLTFNSGTLGLKGGTSSTTGSIRFSEATDNGANTVALTGPADCNNSNHVLTLPAATGTLALTSQISGIANVVEDTTPQLGGNLDVNGKKIISASNGNIEIDPAGTGDVYIHSDDVYIKPAGTTTQAQLNLWELGSGNTHYTGIKSQSSLSSNVIVTLPTVSGTLLTGNQVESVANTLSNSHSSVGENDGTRVYFGGTINMTAGKIYSFTSSGNWALATSTSANLAATGMLAVAIGTQSDTHGMLLQGTVKMSHDAGTAGDVLYLVTNNNSGSVHVTPPSSQGNVVRQMGYCLHSTSGVIYFNPSTDYIVVA